MKTRSTKKALLASLLSLVVCVSMLVGSTFAWFTDSVTSAQNVIQSGNLDVELYYADKVTADDNGNDTTVWKPVTSSTDIYEYNLWEPGYTKVAYFKVVNEGSLALKYTLSADVYNETAGVNQAGESFLLSDYLKTSLVNVGVTRDDVLALDGVALKDSFAMSGEEHLTAGASKVVGMAIWMPTTVGNVANHNGTDVPAIEFGINLFATQQTAESDSFNNQYDKDAEFSVDVKNADELANVLKVGGKVKLVGDIQLSNPVEVPADVMVVMELNGYTITSANSNVIKNYGTLTITNGVLDATTAYTVNNAGGNVTIKNVKSVDAGFYNAGTMLVEDCEITNTISGRHGLYNNANATLVINGLVCSTTSQNAIIYNNNGKVTVNDGAFTQIGSSYMLDGSNITINGGTFTDNDGTWAIRGNGHAISGGTFNFNPNNYVAPGHQVTDNGNGTWTVEREYINVVSAGDKAANGAALAAAITATTKASFIKLPEGEYKMPGIDGNKDVTIVGTKDTVIDVTAGAYMDGSKVAFEGVTIKGSTGMSGSDYAAMYTPDVTYVNCTFVGAFRIGRDGATFINCTFTNLGNDYVWNMNNDTVFEGCTFNTDGKALLLYADGPSSDGVATVVVKNCKFNATKGAKASAIANQNCAAIEIHNHGCSIELISEGNTHDSNFSGMWRIKTYDNRGYTVTVNGTEYTSIAVDGKTMTIDADKNVTVNG